MAGTGNDYIGKVNTTRSNRTCQIWFIPEVQNLTETTINVTDFGNATTEFLPTTTENSGNMSKIKSRSVRHHKVDPEFLNGSLYADMSAEAAMNFCRNPSRSIAGRF